MDARGAMTLCRRSLAAAAEVWDPHYRAAWFHREVASALDDVRERRINRLTLSMPPQHGKSQLVSIFWVAHLLGNNPRERILHFSYSDLLTNEFSTQVLDLMRSKPFRAMFPGCRLHPKCQAKNLWRTTAGGGLLSASLSGSYTGFGGSVVIVDDPIRSAADAMSPSMRAKLIEGYRRNVHTRLRPGARVVVVGTRWHYQDLLGWVRENPSETHPWTHKVYKAYDEVRGWLWPERYSEEEYQDRKHILGPYGWAALYQQDPQPEGASVLDPAWFRVVPIADLEAPRFGVRAMGVDFAVSTRDRADYTCALPGTLYRGDDDKDVVVVLPPYHRRAPWPEARAAIVSLSRAWRLSAVYAESAGQQDALIDDMADLMPTVGVHRSRLGVTVDKDPVARVNRWAPIARSGRIWLAEDGSGWTARFLREAAEFPIGEHDDMISAMTHLLAGLAHGQSPGIYKRGA